MLVGVDHEVVPEYLEVLGLVLYVLAALVVLLLGLTGDLNALVLPRRVQLTPCSPHRHTH